MNYSHFKNDFTITSAVGSQKILFTNYVNLEEDELNTILEWRNSPEIAEWMINNEIISQNDHARFIQNLRNVNNKFYWLVKSESSILGSINLALVESKGDTLHWGIYVNPDYLNSGVGVMVTHYAMEFFFEELNISQLYGEVKRNNFRMRRVLEHFQFTEFNKRDQEVFHNGKNPDEYVRYRYSRDVWLEKREELRKATNRIYSMRKNILEDKKDK